MEDSTKERVLEALGPKYKTRRSDRLTLAANIINGLSLTFVVGIFFYVESFREKRDAYADAAADRVQKACATAVEQERNDRINGDGTLAAQNREIQSQIIKILTEGKIK